VEQQRVVEEQAQVVLVLLVLELPILVEVVVEA
jgi:hypothetical protein